MHGCVIFTVLAGLAAAAPAVPLCQTATAVFRGQSWRLHSCQSRHWACSALRIARSAQGGTCAAQYARLARRTVDPTRASMHAFCFIIPYGGILVLVGLLTYISQFGADGSTEVLVIYAGGGLLQLLLGKTGMDAFLATKAAGGDVGKSHTVQTAVSAVVAAATALDAVTRDPEHGTLLNGKFGALVSLSMCSFLAYRLAVPVVVNGDEAKDE